MQIKNISERILTPALNKAKSVANHSNPFGVSFKGNIITADVFEGAKKSGLVEKMANRGRLAMNAVVGSINSVNQSISTRLNSVASFGRRIKESAISAVKFLNESKIVFNIGGSEGFMHLDFVNGAYSVNNLMKRDVSDLRGELVEAIAARGV